MSFITSNLGLWKLVVQLHFNIYSYENKLFSYLNDVFSFIQTPFCDFLNRKYNFLMKGRLDFSSIYAENATFLWILYFPRQQTYMNFENGPAQSYFLFYFVTLAG